MSRPDELPQPHEPDTLAASMVAVSVYCCRCTYDLRGLPADGVCPECGLPIANTLQHLIDPAASRLPQLRDPVGVGNALVWLVLCLTGATLLLCVQAVAVWAGVFELQRVGMLGMAAAYDCTLLASVAALLGMWSVFKFNPTPGDRANVAVRRDVVALGAGLAGWSILAMVLWQRERHWAFAAVSQNEVATFRAALHAGMAGAAVVIWIGIQRILRTIGKRSRAYRHAHGGRQRIRPMIAATVAIGVGSLLRLAGTSAKPGLEPLATLGAVMVWVSMLMIVIGLVYLLINARWIRQALRHPPPILESLLSPLR